MQDFATYAQSFADIVVYVWLFVLGIALVIGRQFNRQGATFRVLPGFWSPPVSEALHRSERWTENAESFLLLGGLLLLRGTRDLIVVTILALLIDCLNGLLFPKLIKFFGNTNILFCYLGFLLLRGYFEAGIIAIFMTIVVGFLCSGMILGMVPSHQNPVWKAHLLSFMGGIVVARFLDAIAGWLPVSRFW